MKGIPASATILFGLGLFLSSAFWNGAHADPTPPTESDSSLVQEKVSDFNNSISSPASPKPSQPLPVKEKAATVIEEKTPTVIKEKVSDVILEKPVYTDIVPLVPDEEPESKATKEEAPKPDKEKKQDKPVAAQEEYVPYFGGQPLIVEEEGMTPRPKKVAQAPVKKLKKGEHIQIPAEAAKRHDLSFLSGCWDTDATWGSPWGGGGSFPIRKKFCFDKSGRGYKVISARGTTYKGPARARFKGETLHIEAGDLYAPGRIDRFTPETAECRGTGKATRCNGIQVNPDNRRQVKRLKYHLYRN